MLSNRTVLYHGVEFQELSRMTRESEADNE